MMWNCLSYFGQIMPFKLNYCPVNMTKLHEAVTCLSLLQDFLGYTVPCAMFDMRHVDLPLMALHGSRLIPFMPHRMGNNSSLHKATMKSSELTCLGLPGYLKNICIQCMEVRMGSNA